MKTMANYQRMVLAIHSLLISSLYWLWKRETKIKSTLKRKSGCFRWPPCFRWRRLCLSFLKWQPQARPAIVGSHGTYLFRFRKATVPVNNQRQCSLPWYYFAVSPLNSIVMIPCSSPHNIFHLGNIKLHCGFHHCRACFSFVGGIHVSGQIWPKWRYPKVPIIIYVLGVYNYLYIYETYVNLILQYNELHMLEEYTILLFLL